MSLVATLLNFGPACEELRQRLHWFRRELAERLRDWSTRLHGPPVPNGLEPLASLRSPGGPLQPLRHVHIAKGVLDMLFREYLEHRQSTRGQEETGWLIVGLREQDQATILGTIPAGAERDAGESHVRFNAEAQAVAMRLLLQREKRLKLLGVVHTHPGTLRHPSRGDWAGDRDWVAQLPGQQGIFAIGTFDPNPDAAPPIQAHAQGSFRFDWYTLQYGERRYQPQRVEPGPGADVARDLRPVWPILEQHAVELDRLARLFAKVRFHLLAQPEPALGLVIGLAEVSETLQLVLQERRRQVIYEVNGTAFVPDLPAEGSLEQAIYRFLQEWAHRGD